MSNEKSLALAASAFVLALAGFTDPAVAGGTYFPKRTSVSCALPTHAHALSSG